MTRSYKLYVSLGASQTRKRLKGHGYGVRRVETAGTGQAVIVHTATGAHLDRLRALFADVIATYPDDQTDDADLRIT